MGNHSIIKTDEEWAQEGYVLIRIQGHGGVVDPCYVKRKYTGPAITKLEMADLIRRAKEMHKRHARRRASEDQTHHKANRAAMKPYLEQREKRLNAERRRMVSDGVIGLNEMTFWDLI